VLLGFTAVAGAQQRDVEGWSHANAGSEPAPSPDRWQHRRFGLSGVLGLATPVGGIGIDVSYAPVVWLPMFTGVGLGWVGTQVAFGLRPRFVVGGWAFGAEMSTSMGEYADPFLRTEKEPPYPYRGYFRPAYWLNSGMHVEYRSHTGFSLRAFGGYGITMNSAQQCSEESCRRAETPYFGIALGYAYAPAG
jgi:hypothetical protein